MQNVKNCECKELIDKAICDKGTLAIVNVNIINHVMEDVLKILIKMKWFIINY